MVDRATFEPFPTAAFVSIWVGLGASAWTPIGTVVTGLLGLSFGAAAALLSKNSQLVFEPTGTPTIEKRRFLQRIAILQIATTPLLVAALALVLPKVTSFIFPPTWVEREPSVLCYLGGLGIAFGIASFILSRKFA